MMKKMMELFKKWFGKKQVSTVENAMVETLEKHEKKSRKSSLLEDLEAYLFSEYDFRFNLLTEQAEYASKGKANFQQVDQRVLNTLCIDARSQGINCWDKDVSRLLLSQKKFPAAFRGSNASRMGKVLTSLGVERIRTKYGSSYRVMPLVAAA